jgi:hypothetical protein
VSVEAARSSRSGYRTQSPDTHPEIERRLIEGWRRMSTWEKASRLADLALRESGLTGP